jgi:predicted O-methyltransferase YrrM
VTSSYDRGHRPSPRTPGLFAVRGRVRRLFASGVEPAAAGDYRRYLSPNGLLALRKMSGHPWTAGSTDEYALALMGGLLREVQPARVLQIGTHIGLSAVFIGDVLAHNAKAGRLWTVDPDEIALPVARGFVSEAKLDGIVAFVEGLSTDEEVDRTLRKHGPFDVVYLDASHTYRETRAELRLIFEGWLAPSGLLLLHDAARAAAQFDRTHEGGVRRAIDDWTSDHAGTVQTLVLEPPVWPSVCGLGLMRRTDVAGQ